MPTTKKPAKPKAPARSELEKIHEENDRMKDVLQDLSKITSSEMAYAKNSQKMFDEENEAGFYITLVFQNDACAEEFLEKFGDFMGVRDTGQVFVNGHELAKKWGKPLRSPYVRKTVQIDKLKDALPISEVGIYGK